MSQYAPHLHVSDDGHIWWLRQDALRLGAGFLPVCDDNRRLQAPNQRALVNEKNLMAALGDARSEIPKPLTFERDGFRYVDAAGFLEWLSQYICQTQAKIEFPNDLSNEVRIALAKAAAERPPSAPETFESLTLALEGEFDKSLDALPDALRHRVEKEFSPMRWDGLNSDARRSVTLQLDYQRDPTTEADRLFWGDFFNKKGELEKQIEQWRAVAAPTASELAEKERRLKELADELARMERIKKHGRGDYLVEAPQAPSPDKHGRYIAYPKALYLLQQRLKATPEELAAWILMGPEKGGIAAYRNANELNPPPRFYFAHFMGEDYLAPMMGCWFLAEDVDHFSPADRYMTGKALIERWSAQAGIVPRAFIQAKIEESRLIDLHPTYGGTRGSISEDDSFPPLEAGLFVLAHVEEVEAEDFGFQDKADKQKLSVGSPEWRKRNAQAAADARHNKPGGSREKRDAIRAIWASGKYTSRDRCAEEECGALDMSFAAARNALKKQPKPQKKNLSSA